MICHERYPTSLVIVNVLEVLAALAVGVTIIAQFGSWAVLGYAMVGLLALVLCLAFGCTRCYYYGRVCGTGLGRIAALVFEKRDEEEFGRFLSQRISWTLVGGVLLLPIAAGLILLREGFALSRLSWLAAFVGLMVLIVVTHSKHVCDYCREAKQRRCTLGRLGRSL
jgi:glucan phosphoethanolaminetransferase (alkaline phosphatase superfamily)